MFQLPKGQQKLSLSHSLKIKPIRRGKVTAEEGAPLGRRSTEEDDVMAICQTRGRHPRPSLGGSNSGDTVFVNKLLELEL